MRSGNQVTNSSGKTGVGIIGCGDISGQYIRTLQAVDSVEIVACAARNVQNARAHVEQFGITNVCTVEELLADPRVEIVLNLTPPAAHEQITVAALDAGKHVYTEKPLALNTGQGENILKTARTHNRLVGCAPDTVLGAGIETCRTIIEKGEIGRLVGATAFMLCHGHEHWHPNPGFYYSPGGGPLFDMGPYYLTALVRLAGPVAAVSGSAGKAFETRKITSSPRSGEEITVSVPTHYSLTLDFASGAVGTMIMSFDVWSTTLPPIELYGTEGTLLVPDPNTFNGPVRLRRGREGDWEERDLTYPAQANGRGLGLLDMVAAANEKRSPRVSGELGYHILEIMEAAHVAAAEGRRVKIAGRPE